MNKTLKTYPDGSELKTKHAVVFAVGTVVYVGALAYVVERRERKTMKKQSDLIVSVLKNEK